MFGNPSLRYNLSLLSVRVCVPEHRGCVCMVRSETHTHVNKMSEGYNVRVKAGTGNEDMKFSRKDAGTDIPLRREGGKRAVSTGVALLPGEQEKVSRLDKFLFSRQSKRGISSSDGKGSRKTLLPL